MITNKTNDFSDVDFFGGEILLIDKPSGCTSFDVVSRIRGALKVKKTGHAGTLDPLATGLLIVATGAKTKSLSQFQNMNKTYSGSFLLGQSSDSMDTETKCTEHPIPMDLNEDAIYSVRDEFLGEISQLPPMHSAAKINGKRLYKLARRGVEVDRLPRKVFIESFEITNIILPEIFFEITCSKGTYIRVIADDFGRRLGCGAVLSSLRRLKIGEYDVNDAFPLNNFLMVIAGSMVTAEAH
jgi:tRNA pseudouridine55 synthase